MFEKKDFEALSNIQSSSKKQDALKVGRFGLGFQSVFNITGELIV